jgi:nucleoside-diphosphate-sugar epimerase
MNSHVIPGAAAQVPRGETTRRQATVTMWGTGTPRREFLYSDDMADACVFLMNLPDDRYDACWAATKALSGRFEPPLVNIGVGQDVTIAELAELVRQGGGLRRRHRLRHQQARRHAAQADGREPAAPRRLAGPHAACARPADGLHRVHEGRMRRLGSGLAFAILVMVQSKN